MKTIVVLSGGMDSTTALALSHFLGDEVIAAVNFQYGSKHNDREKIAFEKITEHYQVKALTIDLPFVDRYFKSDLLKSGSEIPEGHYADPSMKKTVVPFRNGIMLSIASGLAESLGADGVVLGNHFGDHAIYPDCRTDFSKAMSQAIRLGTYKEIKLITPFHNLTKTHIAKIGSNLKVPFELTWSCYKGQEKHCGKCGTCFERKEAFRDALVLDPTEYSND